MQVLLKIADQASDRLKSGRVVKNDDIAKAVIRSQPPNIDDVPTMVDWYQKWGGGKSQCFVKNLNEFLLFMNIPPST